MLINYYEDGSSAPKRATPGIAILMALNSGFAALILFAWTYIAFFVTESLSWATWMPIHRGYGMVGVFEYPFVMLWLLPSIGVFGAWVSLKGGRTFAAFTFVAVPLMMLALVFGWFYIAPTEWR
jgi:hypothetical protein